VYNITKNVKEVTMQKKPVDARYKMVERTMKKLGYERDALIETLHSAQETFGYLENDTLKFIARKLKLPFSKVYGVATFYHFFRLKPKGEHTTVICTGTACYIKGADKIIEDISKKFSVELGKTSTDGKLSLMGARCVGSCSLAPVVIFDGKVLGHLNGDSSIKEVERILDGNNNS